MGSRIFMTLFALPFLGVGIWAVYSISMTLAEAQAMQGWMPVQARVISAGVVENRDDESTTYRAEASYEYSYQGKTYIASRVGIDTGADNIGDWQGSRGRELEAAQREGRSVEAYVDPGAPYSAVIYRDIRWGMVAFKALFMLAFGGGGLALLLAAPHINLQRGGTPYPRAGDRPPQVLPQVLSAADRTAARQDMQRRIVMRNDAMFYPMGRNLFSGLIGLSFGAVFGGIGVFLFAREDAWFGGAIFGGFGLVIMTACAYALANSLAVRRDSMRGGVETVRCLFGIPVKRQYAALDDIVSLAYDSSSSARKGARDVKFYRVYGRLQQGGDITLGESFEGEAEAEAALAVIREKLGIRS